MNRRLALAATACLAALSLHGAALAMISPDPSPQARAKAQSEARPPRADQPPTPEAIAAARDRADGLIAEAHAQAYFTNITDGAAPKVRHTASGLECVFGLNDIASIRVYDSKGPLRGEDVSCGFTTGLADGAKVSVTVTATHFPANLDDVMGALSGDIRKAMPDAGPAAGRFSSINLADKAGAESMPSHRVARFNATEAGQPIFTRAAAGIVHGWTVSQRTTAPADHATTADLLSEVLLSVAMADVFKATPEPGKP